MRFRTLLIASATGMVATAALVWSTVDPARGGKSSTTTAAVEDPAKKQPEPKPLEDRSHFTAGKTLMASGRLGNAVLPAETESQTFLFVDVTADAASRASVQVPLNLAIAIDRSGSMKGKRMDNAMAAARSAVKRLRNGDIVSVITFNTMAEAMVMPTTIDDTSRAKVLAALDEPRTTGDTCISCGVETGMRLLGSHDNMVSRILLLSDGIPTAGVRDLPGFQRIAEDCRRMNASITTIGVDVDYDEKVMSELAKDSNGGHFFVADPTGLPAILDQEMDALTKTVANSTDLVVDLAPGVFAEQVFDRASTSLGSQLVVPLGSFTAGQTKTLLVRVRVPRGPAGERPVATVRLRYDDLATGKDGSCEGDLIAQLTEDQSKLTPLDGQVSARVSSSETAAALEQANDLFRNGNADEARELIRKKRAEMQMRHDDAMPTVAPAAAPDVEEAFSKQAAALDKATGGMGEGSSSRGGKTQIRANEKDAFDLSN
jgi:Ca-activated chloride channel family protein